jgi:hypothetical protein
MLLDPIQARPGVPANRTAKMAIWQFSMHLVPASELVGLSPGLAGAVPGSAFDDVRWWKRAQPSSDIGARLDAVLAEVRSWNPESRQWGSSESTTVKLHYVEGRIDEVWARLDLRTGCVGLLEVLVRLAEDSAAVWVGGDSEKRRVIGQDREALVEAIVHSDAARFVADPRAFLQTLSTNEPE